MKFLSLLCVVSLMYVGTVGTVVAGEKVPKSSSFGDYDYIDNMTQYVDAAASKQRIILRNKYVVFEGGVMSLPKKQKTDYVQVALGAAGLDPVPVVEQAMFVKVGPEKVIPVYVSESAATDLNNWIKKLGDKAVKQLKLRFAGVHVYNYSKGPAIVVESFELLKVD